MAKPERLIPAANKYAAALNCVSARLNTAQPHCRYNSLSTSNISIIAFTFLLLLFYATIGGAQDIMVLSQLGAVAEKIGEIAVDLESDKFPMVLRLVIHDKIHNNRHSCLTTTFAGHSFKYETNHLIISWTIQLNLALKLMHNKKNVFRYYPRSEYLCSKYPHTHNTDTHPFSHSPCLCTLTQ